MAESHLVLSKAISGKSDPVKLKFVVTSIGSEDDPDYDCYLFSIHMPGMKEPNLREYDELKPKNKQKPVGDVVWSISNVVGDEEDPSDPDEERRIKTFEFSEVIFKTFEDDQSAAMAKVTVTFPFDAVLATENWKE